MPFQPAARMLTSRCARSAPCAGKRSAGGFAYLYLLIFVTVLGIGLSATGQVWHMSVQRERERELLFVGDQFRRAITQYYDASPNQKQYPQKLEDLLDDKRFPFIRRHLRRIYPDPMTGQADWELVTLPGVGIVGLHSRSAAQPIKSSGFSEQYAQFEHAERHSDWVFRAPDRAPGAAGRGQATGALPGAAIPDALSTNLNPAGRQSPGSVPEPGSPAVAAKSPARDAQSARADAEAGCRASNEVTKSQCELVTSRGGRFGGPACFDRAYRQLNECLAHAAQL